MADLNLDSPASWISAEPNPAKATANGYAQVVLTWGSPTATAVEVRVDAPDGPLLAASGPAGATRTGPWVRDGMTFYLQNVSGGLPLTPTHTLATVTVSMARRTRRYDDDAERVFCVSIQRTGTTSVGRFFRDVGFDWAGWPADEKNAWSDAWYEGDFERIFSSDDFRTSNAFEDSPWFSPDFYKVLFRRFPRSRFVLFVRDPDAWFRSMLSHSGGDVIGDTEGHCKMYRRELEFYDLLASGVIDRERENRVRGPKTMKMVGLGAHYKAIYRLHNLEVQDFFARRAPHLLFVGDLSAPDKWQKLATFLGVQVSPDYDSHENRSPDA